MKRLCILFVLVLMASLLIAEQVGTISHIIGEVHYKDAPGAPFVKASRNAPVSLNGEIRTAVDSSAEILWKSGGRTTIAAAKTVSIRSLYEEASTSANSVNKLKRQLSNLLSPKKTEQTNVAGIRRNEITLSKSSELYWSDEDRPDLQAAYELYEQEEFDKAIPLLEQLIEQGPLKKEAEISHALLIIIYHQLGNTDKMNQHESFLKADFPKSTLLQQLSGEN